jgi:hypothetical protein
VAAGAAGDYHLHTQLCLPIKGPVVSNEWLHKETAYPRPGQIACKIINEHIDPNSMGSGEQLPVTIRPHPKVRVEIKVRNNSLHR